MNIYDFFKESVPYIAVVNKLVLGIFNNFVNFLNGTIYVCASAPNENEISRFSPSLRTDLDRESFIFADNTSKFSEVRTKSVT